MVKSIFVLLVGKHFSGKRDYTYEANRGVIIARQQ